MTIPHTTIIIIALAAGCALFLALWLVTLCCWRRSRGSKNTTIGNSSLKSDLLCVLTNNCTLRRAC